MRPFYPHEKQVELFQIDGEQKPTPLPLRRPRLRPSTPAAAASHKREGEAVAEAGGGGDVSWDAPAFFAMVAIIAHRGKRGLRVLDAIVLGERDVRRRPTLFVRLRPRRDGQRVEEIDGKQAVVCWAAGGKP